MSSKLWRLSNQKISAKRTLMLAQYDKMLPDGNVPAQKLTEHLSKIPTLYTKKQARQNTSEEKHPSKLLKSLYVRIGLMHPDVLKFD